MDDKVDPTTYEITQRLNFLEQELEHWKKRTGVLEDDLRKIQLEVNQLRRPKITNDEALRTFDVLKHDDPSLTLPSFAAQHGLSYNALRQARSRRRKKT